jgi:predicted TIM-barrel fold metal-dependent hydrolase
VIDAHVHLFPDPLFDAIWRWFDEHAWPIAHKLYADEVVDRIESEGATRLVGLLYAHKPGMADDLNAWMGNLARRRPAVIPCATIHPRDKDVSGVLRRACELHGARLVKQHCHVIHIAPDDPVMFPIYEACIELDLPLNLHLGNGPKLQGYASPTDAVSGAARAEVVLRRFPELRLLVPHLGCMEEDTFLAWLDLYPNLFLDTAMALTPFLPGIQRGDRSALAHHRGRILFGTDFPNVPYPIDTERRELEALALPSDAHQAITHGNAARLFDV